MRSRVFKVLLLLVVWPTASSGASSTQASPLDAAARRRVAELSRQAVDLIEQHDLPSAERRLLEALSIAPDNSTCLYNLAAVHAGMFRPADALADLDRATSAGFTDFTQLEKNPAFDGLRASPGYRHLLTRRDEIRHLTATRILDELKSQFGDGYRYAADEPHKLAFAAHLDAKSLEEVQSSLLLQETSQGQSLFSHPSDEFIRVVIASPADFSKNEYRADAGGHYDDSTRTVLVRHIGPELRHEFTHALHAADQHALGQEHPVWLSEGLASIYENAAVERPGDGPLRMVPSDNWRLTNVKAAANTGNLIPLEKLLRLDREAFTARADVAYGESGSLLLFLYDRRQLKTFYDAYTLGYASEPSGRSALESTTGMTLPDLQKAWVAWLLPRPASPREPPQSR